MSQIYNVNVQKQSKVKKITHWMRDMAQGFFEYVTNEKKLEADVLDLSTEEGKRIAAERAMRAFDAAFGGQLLNNKSKRKNK